MFDSQRSVIFRFIHTPVATSIFILPYIFDGNFHTIHRSLLQTSSYEPRILTQVIITVDNESTHNPYNLCNSSQYQVIRQSTTKGTMNRTGLLRTIPAIAVSSTYHELLDSH